MSTTTPASKSPLKRYTLPALRRYLAAQPAKTWNNGDRHRDETHCVLGHLEVMLGRPDYGLDDSHPIIKRFKPLVNWKTPMGAIKWAMTDVNNGADPRYKQRSPRARVLRAIDDLIARKVPKA